MFDGSTEISKPATFFVLKGGSIAYKYVGEAPSDRPTALDLVNVADEHKIDTEVESGPEPAPSE